MRIRTAAEKAKGAVTKTHCVSRYVVLYLVTKSALRKVERRNGEERKEEERVCRSFEAQGRSAGLDTCTASTPVRKSFGLVPGL